MVMGKILIFRNYVILFGLHSKGRVESYAYSAQDQEYVSQAPIAKYPQTGIWGYVTNEGEKSLKQLHTDST